MKNKFVHLVVLALALISPQMGLSQPAAESSEEVTVTGCVAKGVEGGCWVLTDQQGKVYSFTSSQVRENKCYQVTGVKAMGFCMQGTQLAVKKADESETDCCKQ